MKTTKSLIFGLTAGVLLLGSLLVGCAQPMSPPPASNSTTAVDTTDFPNIRLRLPCADPILNPQAHLTVNDINRNVQRSNPVAVHPKNQIAVFFDLYKGSQGLIQPMGDTLEGFYTYYSQRNDLVAAENSFAAFRPGPDPQSLALTTVVTWTNQPTELIDAVRALTRTRLADLPAYTPLVGSLRQVLRKFDTDKNARRAVIVFSDGVDKLTKNDLNILVDEARARSIPLYTFFVQARYNDSNYQLLESIARGTQFEPTVLPQGATLATLPPGLEKLWFNLVKPTYQCQFSFRALGPEAMPLLLTDSVSGTVVVSTTMRLPGVALSPPRVELSADQTDLQLRQGVTQTIGLTVGWSFDHYPNRAIKAITYKIQGAGVDLPIQPISLSMKSPLSQIILAPGLPAGDYTIRVNARDEFGASGAAVLPFVVLAPPPPPSITPEPTTAPKSPTPSSTSLPAATTQPPPTPDVVSRLLDSLETNYSGHILYGYLFLLMLILLPLAAYALSQIMEKSRRTADYSPSADVSPGSVKAVLFRIQTPPMVNGKIEIQQIVKLYRALELPQALFQWEVNATSPPAEQQTYLPLAQAVIEPMPDGYQLRLKSRQDADSVKVNQKTVKISQPQQLNNQDIIQFGEVHYRFILIQGSGQINRNSSAVQR